MQAKKSRSGKSSCSIGRPSRLPFFRIRRNPPRRPRGNCPEKVPKFFNSSFFHFLHPFHYLCARKNRSNYVEQKITPHQGHQGAVRPSQIRRRQHDGFGKNADGLRRQGLRPLFPDYHSPRRGRPLRRTAAGARQTEKTPHARGSQPQHQVRRQRRENSAGNATPN